MKENTTGQTVYKQLQEFLNECIKLGRSCRGLRGHKTVICLGCVCDRLSLGLFSYHELFSKDSGIMERVEWKDNQNEYLLNVKVYNDGIDADMAIGGMNYDNKIRMLYHYFEMSSLTADSKIEYFLSNAKLPTKSE